MQPLMGVSGRRQTEVGRAQNRQCRLTVMSPYSTRELATTWHYVIATRYLLHGFAGLSARGHQNKVRTCQHDIEEDMSSSRGALIIGHSFLLAM